MFVIRDSVMTVPYKIIIGIKTKPADRKQIQGIIDACFQEIDQVYNKWNPQSELSKINKSPGMLPIPLSSKLDHFLHLMDYYVTLTAGKFDPTIEPVQLLWKKNLEAGQIPSQEDLEKISDKIGWDKITLRNGYLIKKNRDVQLDLGGIIKGHAVDLLVERLNNAGYKDVFVEWGGEIRTSGYHPENRPWTIFISRLGDADPGHAIATLDISNKAVATSGDYLQQWTVDSRTYFHIIDPYTKTPLIATHASVASVTIQADSCLEADVLATAGMVFQTVAEAQTWAEQFPDIKFRIDSRESLK